MTYQSRKTSPDNPRGLANIKSFQSNVKTKYFGFSPTVCSASYPKLGVKAQVDGAGAHSTFLKRIILPWHTISEGRDIFRKSGTGTEHSRFISGDTISAGYGRMGGGGAQKRCSGTVSATQYS